MKRKKKKNDTSSGEAPSTSEAAFAAESDSRDFPLKEDILPRCHAARRGERWGSFARVTARGGARGRRVRGDVRADLVRGARARPPPPNGGATRVSSPRFGAKKCTVVRSAGRRLRGATRTYEV